jgi:PPM family protein phosphatase
VGVAAGEGIVGVIYIAVSALSHIGVVRDHHEDRARRHCSSRSALRLWWRWPTGSVAIPGVRSPAPWWPAGSHRSAHSWIPRTGSARRSAPATVRCTRRARERALTAMGTTVAGVVVTSDQVLAFNVGDSRVYAAGPGGLNHLRWKAAMEAGGPDNITIALVRAGT